jgi:hypothetical protein
MSANRPVGWSQVTQKIAPLAIIPLPAPYLSFSLTTAHQTVSFLSLSLALSLSLSLSRSLSLSLSHTLSHSLSLTLSLSLSLSLSLPPYYTIPQTITKEAFDWP